MIPLSNFYLERMYSFVNIIKIPIRNQLEVDKVSKILHVKLYYDDNDIFEPYKNHYFFYKHDIHDKLDLL